MAISGLILRNALRNKRRFTFTVLSVAISLFLLTVLQVVLRGLTDPATTDQAALRIVVRHKVSLANMLFAKYSPARVPPTTNTLREAPVSTFPKDELLRFFRLCIVC